MIHTVHVGKVSIMRHEGMDSGWDMPVHDPYSSPTFSGLCSIPGIVCFNMSSFQLNKGIPSEIE